MALVTGATGMIGAAIARQLASRPGWRVVLVGRDAGRARVAVEDIVQRTGNLAVSAILADLSCQQEIEALRVEWSGPLHVLVNCAAVTPVEREETREGIEVQFATNVLGYHGMIRAFQDVLIASAPARVVNVASYWAGDLDLSDLEFRRRPYSNGVAYRQSKQADRMLTVAWAERLRVHQVTVNACHPGDANSPLSNRLGFGGHDTPDESARTPVWLAAEAAGGQQTGRYFEHQRPVQCRFGADRDAVEALFAICQRYSEGELPLFR